MLSLLVVVQVVVPEGVRHRLYVYAAASLFDVIQLCFPTQAPMPVSEVFLAHRCPDGNLYDDQPCLAWLCRLPRPPALTWS